MKQVETWGELATAISELTEEQRGQPIQCLNPTPDENDVQVMESGIALGTVKDFEFYRCRSTHNNRYCPGDVVLLIDDNPHNEHGVVAWDITSGPDDVAIYGKSGKTEVEDQTAPNKDELLEKWDSGLVGHVDAMTNHRCKEVEERC